VALPNDGIAPDRFELRLRFVFGAIAGGILVPVLLLRVLQPSASAAAIGVIGAAAGALGAACWPVTSGIASGALSYACGRGHGDSPRWNAARVSEWCVPGNMSTSWTVRRTNPAAIRPAASRASAPASQAT